MSSKTTTALTVTVLLSLVFAHRELAGQTTQPKPRPASGGTMVFVHVTNTAGRPVPDVRLQIDGVMPGQFKTDIEGTIRLTAMRDGAYHLRFEKAGFSAMERALTLRGGQPDVLNVVLTTELEKAKEPAAASLAKAPQPSTASFPAAKSVAAAPAAPASAPAASTKPASLPAATSAPAEERTVSITAFLDKNYIGREPVKESLLGCTASTRTRLLQLREGLSEHTHDTTDETLYVVAGEGAIVIANRAPVQVGPASLVVIPSGLPHAVQRRGKNPLIVLSTLSGSPCSDTVAASDHKP
jgi:mannose-6-phosphate isomerase-like protein (cupin superfamily)